MKKTIFFGALIAGSVAFAQTLTQNTNPVMDQKAQATSQMTTTVKPSSLRDYIILGYKSANDTGRFGYSNQTTQANPKDKRNAADNWVGVRYKGKHEAKVGMKDPASGWGGYLQMTQYRYDFNEDQYSKWSVSDPSVSLLHPTIYNNGPLKMTGFVRYYLPLTDRSRLNGIKQFSYYQDTVYQMGYGQEIFNEINPRIFIQDKYSSSDSRYKIEDITTYSRKLGNWGRWGVGQWTQHEQHAQTPSGTTVDVYPYMDIYIDGPKTMISPRIYTPVFVQNSVYDGSRNTTTDNAYFEVFFQANL